MSVTEDLDAGDKPREGHALPVAVRQGAGDRGKSHDPGHEDPDGDVNGAPEHQAPASDIAGRHLASLNERRKSGQ
jgi:hypothetical protein